jgi:AcrR family transcriptional regulator
MTGAEGLRERKKLRTRETIARVALELFSQQGFHATTIKQIADAAEVAPRTVSGYFPCKEELVFPDHEEVFRELQGRLAERKPGESTADALRAFIGWLVGEREQPDHEVARRRRDVIDAHRALRTFERGLLERAERAIAAAAAVDLGLDAEDLLPHMVAAATIAALDALGRTMNDSAAPEELRAQGLELADQALTFVGGGVDALARRVRG